MTDFKKHGFNGVTTIIYKKLWMIALSDADVILYLTMVP